jgi:hypothetical protein
MGNSNSNGQNPSLRPFPGTTTCSCKIHCHHRNPEINHSTRANHRRDEEIHYGRRISWKTRGHPYARPSTSAGTPHDHHTGNHNSGPTQLTPEAQVQSTADREGPRDAEPPASSSEHQPGLRAQDLRAFQVMEAELDLRKLLSVTSLDRPLEFRNPPKDNGHFDDRATTIHPNTGLHALTNHKNNRVLVENEERLNQLLTWALLLPHCERRAQILDRIHQGMEETIREKALHWEEQRLSVDMNRVIVYNSKPPS